MTSITIHLFETRARIVELHDILSAQRAAWRSSGKFCLRTLAEVQRLTAMLPNPKDESLAALARFGTPASIAADDPLPLAAIGWNAALVRNMEEAQRIRATEQAIAMLSTREDPELLAAALVLARSLGNDRREWEERITPLATWAKKHKAEIEEEAAV